MKMEGIPVLSLAPMAGLTDWPLRVLCYRMGADYACTEMVSAVGLLCAKPDNKVYQQLLHTHPQERNTACQLFGKDPTVMGEAAQKLTELGRFTSLDINMGCPARKVVSLGEGSAMLLTPDKAFRVMEAVKTHTSLPVTLKTRLGYDEGSMNALELGKAAQSLHFQWICVHGRTREQQYSGLADHQAIARLREQLSLPVLSNGDLCTPEDVEKAFTFPGCPGVMIGRGALGNPWLFRTARQKLEGRRVEEPSLEERIHTALLHLEWMVDYKGQQQGLMEMRKHLGHYISGLRGATAVRRALNTAKTQQQMRELLLELLGSARGQEEP